MESRVDTVLTLFYLYRFAITLLIFSTTFLWWQKLLRAMLKRLVNYTYLIIIWGNSQGHRSRSSWSSSSRTNIRLYRHFKITFGWSFSVETIQLVSTLIQSLSQYYTIVHTVTRTQTCLDCVLIEAARLIIHLILCSKTHKNWCS